jgi:ribosome-binding protein aMBF1 (putative translation factor)
MQIDTLINRIRAYRRHKDWTVSQLATEAGLNEATIRHLDDPDWSPNVRTLRALEKVVPASFKMPRCKSGEGDRPTA